MKKIILVSILFINPIFSQQTPSPDQKKSILIYGAITHIGNGEVVENSVIGFSNGVIDLVSSTDGSWNNEMLNMFSDSNSKKYDTIILFNTLEHIYNYKNLISEISRILKDKGKLEIFVPFLIGYHPDPNDVFRPTHNYLEKILKEYRFSNETNLVGVGPFMVSYQMIYRYLKFSVIKLFFFIIAIILDKLVSLFSKDSSTYYCGTHISSTKI